MSLLWHFYYVVEILLTLPLVSETLLCVIDVRTKKITAHIAGMLSVLFTIIVQEIILWKFGLSFYDTYKFSFFTSLLPSFAVFCCLAKKRNAPFFFSFLTIHILAASTTTISYLLSFMVFNNNQIAETIIHSLMLFLILLAFKKFFCEKYFIASKVQGHKWHLYLLLPCLIFLFWVLYNSSEVRRYNLDDKMYFPYLGYNYSGDLPALLTLQIVIFYMTILVMIVIMGTYTINMKDYEKKMITVQFSQFKSSIDNMLENETRMKVIRHDMRHHMQTLYQILENGDLEKAKNYLTEFSNIIPSTTFNTYTGNTVIDIIISLYEKRCEENNISIKISCTNISDIKITETKIASVISNVLENAFIACTNIDEDFKPRIEFSFLRKNKQMLLDVSNTYTGKVSFDKNHIPVSKEEKGHGIGTLSIQEFCAEHKASVAYSAENGFFRVSIMFKA